MKILLFLTAWAAIEILDRLFRPRLTQWLSNSNNEHDFQNTLDEPRFFSR